MAPLLEHKFVGASVILRCRRCKLIRQKKGESFAYARDPDGPWYREAEAFPCSEPAEVVAAREEKAGREGAYEPPTLAYQDGVESDWIGQDILAIDTETTGLCPLQDRIIEIAAVRVRVSATGAVDILDRFCSLVHPLDVVIPARVTEVNGIRNDMVNDAPPFWEVAPEIARVGQGCVVALAYNAPFDRKFISHTYARYQDRCASPGCLMPEQKWFDPMVWAKAFAKEFRKGAYKLGAVASRLGVSFEGTAHRADVDTIAASQVFGKLVRHVPPWLPRALSLQEVMRAKQEAEFLEWLYKQQASKKPSSSRQETPTS